MIKSDTIKSSLSPFISNDPCSIILEYDRFPYCTKEWYIKYSSGAFIINKFLINLSDRIKDEIYDLYSYMIYDDINNIKSSVELTAYYRSLNDIYINNNIYNYTILLIDLAICSKFDGNDKFIDILKYMQESSYMVDYTREFHKRLDSKEFQEFYNTRLKEYVTYL